MVAFEENLKPIGFNIKAQLSQFQFKKSAFSVTSKFINKFKVQDDTSDVCDSQEESPSKLYGSPDTLGKAQSIFSEQTYQVSSSPSKKASTKSKSNRLLQMTMNVN